MTQITVTPQKALVAALAVAVVGLGVSVGVLATSGPSCQSDPAAQIAALPAGSTFNGTGNCYTTEGLTLTKPVVINGGTFNDPDVRGDTSAPFNPIITIKQTSGVTVENVTLNGTNTAGGYHGNPYVGEVGIKVTASNNVELDNVTTNATFGDGLEFGFSPRKPPNVNMRVNGYTVNQAGRQGVTVAFLFGASLDGVTVNSAADTGVDFESDVGVGSGDVFFQNANIHKSVWLQEPLQSPISFTDSTLSGHVIDRGGAATSMTPVMFTGGSLTIARRISGTPPGGIWIDGPGNLVFNNVPIGRPAGVLSVTGLPWVVENGGHLSLTASPLSPITPIGVHDPSSSVSVSP